MNYERSPSTLLANKHLEALLQNLGLSDIQVKGQYLNL